MSNSSESILANGYSIFHGTDAWRAFSKFINPGAKTYASVNILVDAQVEQFCLPALIEKAPSLANASIIRIPSGEASKNIDTVIQIWKTLQENGATRHSLLINLGGGVITDTGGFAASTFKRGMDFINIPTTLLGQVDAAIGGKTGIDFLEIKNQVGLIKCPAAVFVFPEYLKTQDHEQLRSGYAEILKYGLITDKQLWESAIGNHSDFSNYSESTWRELIQKSLIIKNDIVLKDPEEQGLRKLLNFGHTVGHAIEAHALKNDVLPISHGRAVAIGMICEAYISSRVLNLSTAELDQIAQALLRIFEKGDLLIPDDSTLIELMRHDKKNVNSNISFTLLNSIASAEIDQHCETKIISEALNYYRDL
jgi:3-dehydroquinate synthase